MSDTPRTDANERAVFDNGNANGGYTDADFARQLERENAALREQLAERDAEIAALKGHAEAMHGLLIRTMPKLTPADEADFLVEIQNAICAYRAAYPKEANA